MKDLVERINELSKKSKTIEGLTKKEELEQEKLRKEYLKKFRNQFEEKLLNVDLIDRDGKNITSKKVKDERKRRGLNKK